MARARENRSSATGRRHPETLTREEYRIALEAMRPEFSDIDWIVFGLLIGQGEKGITPEELAGFRRTDWQASNSAIGNLAKRIQKALPPLLLPLDRGEPLQFTAICEYDEVEGGVPWVLRGPIFEAASDLGLPGIALDEEDPSDDSPQAYAREGAVKYRMHKYYERKPGRRMEKLMSVLAATGRLACELCGSEFREQYGPDPRFCFDVHHRVPLSKLDGPMDVHLDDLSVLCVLCHRFVHSLPELPSVAEARELFFARSENGVS